MKMAVTGGRGWWRRRFVMLGECLGEKKGGKSMCLRCWTYL